MFRTIKAQRLMLEYDDARSGSFAPLADVPDDKFVVLGLITTKRGGLESLDVLHARVAEASQYVEAERLGISPQCGFASSIVGNAITAAEQKRKLELLVRAATVIWS